MRTKRGLLNFVGSISKTLFGTLDEDDLSLVNGNIDKLFSQQNQITHTLQNQTQIIKALLDCNGAQRLGAHGAAHSGRLPRCQDSR